MQLLEREKLIYLENPNIQPDLEGKDYIVERQLKPEARKTLSITKRNRSKATAMIDISDGLLPKYCTFANKATKAATCTRKKSPRPNDVRNRREFNLDPTICALSGGEDYELLFTLNKPTTTK